MYEFMINDESRPLPERKAWMVLSHVPEVYKMRIDSIERCVSNGDGHEVVLRSCGRIYVVRTERDYTNPTITKQEIKEQPERRKYTKSYHSKAYDRLSAQLFPTLA